MSIKAMKLTLQDSFTRLLGYQKRHGFVSTYKRLFVWLPRALRCYRTVLYYCDFKDWKPVVNSTAPFMIERKKSEKDLSAEELMELETSWNPSIIRRLIDERFQRGASMWVVKHEKQLVAYGWTLTGNTMERHCFPLGMADVHLFDFYVLPSYRGRRINRLLVWYILDELAAEGKSRAFIEAEEWNQPQLSSLRGTPFQSVGRVHRFKLFGKTLVIWNGDN